MNGRKHKLDEVLRSLGRKNDIRIVSYQIQMLSDKVYNNKTKEFEPNSKKNHDVGNGTWGKIDYLTKQHDYRLVHVESFKRD